MSEFHESTNDFKRGYRAAVKDCVTELMRQYEGCQPGTLVSYHIASDVLRVEMEHLMKAIDVEWE